MVEQGAFRGAIRDGVSFHKRNSTSTCIKSKRLETNLVDISVVAHHNQSNGNYFFRAISNLNCSKAVIRLCIEN